METKQRPWRPKKTSRHPWRPSETIRETPWRPGETIRETPGDQVRQLDPSRDPRRLREISGDQTGMETKQRPMETKEDQQTPMKNKRDYQRDPLRPG
ncbi:MAG: hypothetical protein OXU78_11395, partial [Deltaproteobacteria bacterium]|nr:hypothetical protein [Deltaproteobacteria bacterium]